MEINTAIEVQEYGDFNMPYTQCIMVHKQSLNTKELLDEFYSLNGMKGSDGFSGNLNQLTNQFIDFLTGKGFSKLKTTEVIFSD